MRMKFFGAIIFIYLLIFFGASYRESKKSYYYKVLKIEKGHKGGDITYDSNGIVRFNNFSLYKQNIKVNDIISKEKCSNKLYILRALNDKDLVKVDSVIGNKFLAELACFF